jgi:cytolysin-activating lysine-acyltransferase
MRSLSKTLILEAEQKDSNLKILSIEKRLQMVGSITHLMMSSPLHRQYKILDIAERFIPALLHNQFRYYEIDGNPIGFVNWAWLTDEAQEKFQTGQYVLKVEEWTGGKNLWFLEFIAPFGHARAIVKDLRTNVLPKGTPGKSFRTYPDGTFKSLAHWTV